MIKRAFFLTIIGVLATASVAAFSPSDLDQATLSNDTGYEILWMFVTPTDTDQIGADILERDTLPAGESFDFLAHSDTDYRIIAIDEDYDYFEKTVDFRQNANVSLTMDDFQGHYGEPGIARINVTNDLGDWDIEYLFLTLDYGSWGVDVLDATTIMTPGETYSFDVEASDMLLLDVYAVDEDGDIYKAVTGVDRVLPGGTRDYDFNFTLDKMQARK